MKPLDIAWMAGVLEGEASFGYYKGTPTIQVQMTDGDIIERIRALFGTKARAVWKRKDGYLPVHSSVALGTVAIGWMMTLYPFMGQRRRAKIREVIAQWKASDRRPRAPMGKRFMAECHPERVRCGKGLCRPCYMKKFFPVRGNGKIAAMKRASTTEG